MYDGSASGELYLDTPRMITDTAGNVVWEWQNSDPFGANMPNENPSGQGTFTNNLRFAGQYFDKETGLHQNRFRDYDPANGGRYIESDPIGLAGGSFSTFIYVGGNPLSFVDPNGLTPQGAAYGAVLFGGTAAALSVAADVGTFGLNIPATPAEIALATAAGAIVGDVVSDFANSVSNMLDNVMLSKGERGYSGSAGGTQNPDKHWKDDPKNPGWGWQKDPQTGKKTYKKRPPYIKCP